MGKINDHAQPTEVPLSSFKGNIYLVGMMGAGKTSVGRLLAKRARKSFFDSDQVIEERTGVSIARIFHHEGEEGFRAREQAVIADLTALDNIVLATGGGAILSDDNRKSLGSTGFVVYLKAQVEDLWKRTQADKNRPLLDTENPLERLKDFFQVRDPIYTALADLVVETGDPNLQTFLNRLELELINARAQ
ncbi:MAG: shikimate kinase [Proteobacteria bacterium]|nr:shikimate kinase [Pseudomonadota bacterium]MDA1332334.1 shikimate kinase [Pseudomonadota bacterium]